MGRTIQFPANGRDCAGYLAEPASGAGRGGGVIVIQEGVERTLAFFSQHL